MACGETPNRQPFPALWTMACDSRINLSIFARRQSSLLENPLP
jgi:hypothetical protein